MSDRNMLPGRNSCQCGPSCLLSWEDRSAVWEAAYEAGFAAGMAAHVKEEFGALADAVALTSWVEARIMAHAKRGESWADLVAGERPMVGGDRRE